MSGNLIYSDKKIFRPYYCKVYLQCPACYYFLKEIRDYSGTGWTCPKCKLAIRPLARPADEIKTTEVVQNEELN